ncbi:MAG: hypothetical protein M3N95_17125 [Actinomycetota bacterium]|nr:hypothetical protein [Actinomycetota bacterium]
MTYPLLSRVFDDEAYQALSASERAALHVELWRYRDESGDEALHEWLYGSDNTAAIRADFEVWQASEQSAGVASWAGATDGFGDSAPVAPVAPVAPDGSPVGDALAALDGLWAWVDPDAGWEQVRASVEQQWGTEWTQQWPGADVIARLDSSEHLPNLAAFRQSAPGIQGDLSSSADPSAAALESAAGAAQADGTLDTDPQRTQIDFEAVNSDLIFSDVDLSELFNRPDFLDIVSSEDLEAAIESGEIRFEPVDETIGLD